MARFQLIILLFSLLAFSSEAKVADCIPSERAPGESFKPIHTAPGMRERDDAYNVPLLRTPEEQAKHLIRIESGMLKYPNGKPLEDGIYLFVMDQESNLYAANEIHHARYHHSTFLGGEAVGSAGMLKIEKGKLALINSGSGHYLPTPAEFRRTVEVLFKKGVNFADVRHSFGGDQYTWEKLPTEHTESFLFNSVEAIACVEKELFNPATAEAEDFLLLKRLDPKRYEATVERLWFSRQRKLYQKQFSRLEELDPEFKASTSGSCTPGNWIRTFLRN